MKETKNMVSVSGNSLTLLGEPIKVGDIAPDFEVINAKGAPVRLSDFKGKRVVISVFPSIDTPVCAAQERHFNERAMAADKDLVVLSISKDLPFALSRFCAAEGLSAVHPLSDYKHSEFGEKYGFLIKENLLLSRGVVVIDANGKVEYVEYVSDLTHEPAYASIPL